MSPFHLRDAMSVIGPPQQGTAAAVSRPYHGHMYLDRNSATGTSALQASSAYVAFAFVYVTP